MAALRLAFASVLAALAAGILLPTLAAPARADMAGTAEGALMLDDRPTALTHAYVIEVSEIPEMQFGDGPARTYSVLLTDRPFPDGQTPSDMAAHRLSFEGNLRGIGFEVNPETGEVSSGRTLLPEAEGPQFFTVITMNALPMVVLEDWAEADGHLRGHVRTPEPMDVVNFDGDPDLPAAFTFDATFDAAIIRAPQLVETLEGDAARQGPHAAAVLRFVEAIAAKDMAAIRDAVAAGDPMLDQLTEGDLEMMNSMMLEDGQMQPADMVALVTKVYVFDNASAVVVLQHSDTETSTFPLAQDGDGWKIGQR